MRVRGALFRPWAIWLAAVSLLACSEPDGLTFDLSSRVTPLDRLTVTVVGAQGSLLVDEETERFALPGRLTVDTGERHEHVLVFVWGWSQGKRQALGSTELDVAPGQRSRYSLVLDTPPQDSDGDGIPDAFDTCARVANPQQDANTCATGCMDGLLPNPGFETTGSGWYAYLGTLSRIPGGQSGSFAGRVCAEDGGVPYFTLAAVPRTVIAPSPGSRYRLEAWVRSASGGTQQVEARFREYSTAQGNDVVSESTSGASAVGSDWSLLSATHSATHGGGSVEVFFGSLSPPAAACFDIDSVCLRQVP